jgi:hypothetical protein
LRGSELLGIVVRMPKELLKIDTSALDELAAINEQLQHLKEYCDKAESLKGDVDPAVFERVIADYARRRASLEEKAAPLKVDARSAYQELEALYESLKRSLDEAVLQKQELEFRCKVGELDDKELEKQLRETEATLTQRKSDFGEVEVLHKRFLEALGSEVDVEIDMDMDKTVLAERAPLGAAEAQATIAAAAVVQSRPKASQTSSADAKTVLVPKAMLLADGDGTESTEFSLGTTNYIGSNGDNQVTVAGRGVSRKHALIKVGMEGFAIKDLKSRNGTLVNGERVVERPLADGDRITIGELSFVFRVR